MGEIPRSFSLLGGGFFSAVIVGAFLLCPQLAAGAISYSQIVEACNQAEIPLGSEACPVSTSEDIAANARAWDRLSPAKQSAIYDTVQKFKAGQTGDETARKAAQEALEKQRDILNPPRPPAGCPGGWRNLTRPIDCLFVPVIVYIFGGLIMSISGLALEFAGYLFDILVSTLVVAFASTLGSLGMMEGIHTGWTVLRDISNIVIIGMFTFIAISIIIGNHTFGDRKLVAKVLVVAVLINFSLLFAKIIIDASNFFSWQIYKSMAPSGTENGVLQNIVTSGTGANIAGKFNALIKSSQIFSVTQTAIQAGSDPGSVSNFLLINTAKGALKGVFFAIVGSALLLTAAGVLFYGAFLIAARAVLLVFLMLVSALAFASYLIPSLSDGEYGWKTWWRSLINASLFGPLLMVLLYVSLVILTPIHNKVEGRSLVAILSNPSGGAQQASNDWQMIIVIIFGIGMLYASIKVANSFAGKIAGFSTSGMVPGAALGVASRATGVAGRYAIGWPATWGTKKLRDKGWGEGTGISGAIKRSVLTNTQRLSNAPLDPFQSKTGKKFASSFGIPSVLQGMKTGQKGWVDTQKASAHAAEELERKIGYTKDKKKEIQEKEISTMRAEVTAQKAAASAELERHKSAAAAVEERRGKEVETAKNNQGDDRTNALDEIVKREKESQEHIASGAKEGLQRESDRRVAEQRIVHAAEGERATQEEALKQLIAKQHEDMQKFEATTQANQKSLETAIGRRDELNRKAEAAAGEVLKPELERIGRATEETTGRLNKLIEEEKKIASVAAEKAGERTQRSTQNILNGWSNMFGAWQHPAHGYVKDAIDEHHKNEDLEKLAAAMAKRAQKKSDHAAETPKGDAPKTDAPKKEDGH